MKYGGEMTSILTNCQPALGDDFALFSCLTRICLCSVTKQHTQIHVSNLYNIATRSSRFKWIAAVYRASRRTSI